VGQADLMFNVLQRRGKSYFPEHNSSVGVFSLG
jgi:hypothetical protein